MLLNQALVFIFTYTITVCATKETQSLVDVTIYYEALCPHSVGFFKKQFYPTYEHIGKYMTVKFVPYGKATHNYVNFKWEFECQHGQAECYGNKMQACALHNIYTQEVQVKFVHCVMASGYASSNITLQQCAINNNISWDAILECRDNGIGDGLLAMYGEKTYDVQPTITYIPTVIFNDVFNQNNQNKAMKNFYKAVCDAMGKNKPSKCVNS